MGSTADYARLGDSELTLRQRWLAQKWLPLARRLAWRAARAEPRFARLSADELQGAAHLALVRTARHYDPARGSFGAYLQWQVRGEVAQAARDTLYAVQMPSGWGRGAAKGFSPGARAGLDAAVRRAAPLEASSGVGLSLAARISAGGAEAADRAAARVEQLLAELPPRWARAVRLVHLDGLLYREAGARLGCSQERVRQMLRQAEARMRGDWEGEASAAVAPERRAKELARRRKVARGRAARRRAGRAPAGPGKEAR